MLFELLKANIRGKSCRLELMRPRDAPYVVAWRNDPENAQWFLNAAVFTVDGHNKWLETRNNSTSEVNWIIEDQDGEPVGTVSIYNIDPAIGRAEFGRLLIGSPDARGRRLGCEAVHLATRLAIEAGLRELYLEVKASNQAARSLYTKAGFQQASEGDVIKMTKRLEGASNG